MNKLNCLALLAIVTLTAINNIGCQSKSPPDSGAASQNGAGTGGSGTGTNAGDAGTHAP